MLLTKDSLQQKQEKMRLRIVNERQKKAEEKKFIQSLKEEIKTVSESVIIRLCISCKRRHARTGQVFCSRCTVSGLQNSLRDTLPGMEVHDAKSSDQKFEKPSVQLHNPGELELRQTGTSESTPRNGDGNDDRSSDGRSHDAPVQDGLPPQIEYNRAQVCKILGIAPTTLFRWERKGKVPEPKRKVHNGQCVYTEEDIAFLKNYMAQEYQPHHTNTPKDPREANLPRAVKRFGKTSINRSLERIVSNRINKFSGRGLL